MCWLNVGRDLVARAFNSLSGWSAGSVWLVLSCLFRFWSLIYGRPLTLTLSHEGERGQSFGCRSIAASLYWVRAGETGYSFLIQNTASPMSPDHRSSGRFLVGEPFGVSQFLSIVVL